MFGSLIPGMGMGAPPAMQNNSVGNMGRSILQQAMSQRRGTVGNRSPMGGWGGGNPNGGRNSLIDFLNGNTGGMNPGGVQSNPFAGVDNGAITARGFQQPGTPVMPHGDPRMDIGIPAQPGNPLPMGTGGMNGMPLMGMLSQMLRRGGVGQQVPQMFGGPQIAPGDGLDPLTQMIRGG